MVAAVLSPYEPGHRSLDQRDGRMLGALARFALQPARLAHMVEVFLEAADAFVDQAFIDFELRFTRAAEEAETAALAFQVGP